MQSHDISVFNIKTVSHPGSQCGFKCMQLRKALCLTIVIEFKGNNGIPVELFRRGVFYSISRSGTKLSNCSYSGGDSILTPA